jgi:hypothetical protein
MSEALPITLWHTTIAPTVWLVILRQENHLTPELYTNSILAYQRIKELSEKSIKADWQEVPVWSELQSKKSDGEEREQCG